MQEFPLIDEDTYRAIRQRRRYSRTWYFRIKFYLPKIITDIVFFFGPNSVEARNLDQSIAFTASLHISRFDSMMARYVGVRDEGWSRLQEIVHNGSALGVVYRNDGREQILNLGEEARVENWLAILVEDVIANVAGIDLGSLV
jgi:hypothetical protein